MMRTIPALALALLLTPAAVAATLELEAYGPGTGITPGQPVRVTTTVLNRGNEVANDVVLRVGIPRGTKTEVLSLGWNCTNETTALVCRRSIVPGGLPEGSVSLEFLATVPDDQWGTLELPVSVEAANAPRVEKVVRWGIFHIFRVTTVDDDGAGSLRAAIADVNAQCGQDTADCKVVFHLAPGASIAPITPLPPITACGSVLIDGGTSSRLNNRPVELTGARVSGGSGLEVRARCEGGIPRLIVQGLAVNRFPVDGIRVHPEGTLYRVSLSGLFVGTDVSGRHARRNEWRGISITSSAAQVSIGGSIVSGNRRSGVWIWNSSVVEMYEVLVGIGSDELPMPNGASGVFILHGVVRGSFNVIAHNAQWGVTAVPGAGMGLVHANSIHSNGVLGLDWGVNGPDREETPSGPAAPVITSATYDPATDRTTIRGTIAVTRLFGKRYEVAVYANTRPNASGHYEAERWLGRAEPYSIYVSAPGVYPWEVVARGDARGRVLTAVTGVGPADDFPLITGSEVSAPYRFD